MTVCREYTVSGDTIPEAGCSCFQPKTISPVCVQVFAAVLASGLTSLLLGISAKCSAALAAALASPSLVDSWQRRRIILGATGVELPPFNRTVKNSLFSRPWHPL